MVTESTFDDNLKQLEEWLAQHKSLPKKIGEISTETWPLVNSERSVRNRKNPIAMRHGMVTWKSPAWELKVNPVNANKFLSKQFFESETLSEMPCATSMEQIQCIARVNNQKDLTIRRALSAGH